LFAAATRSTITDATSFTLPAQVVDSGVDSAVGTQTEGTNRADNAALTFLPATVAPTGIVGLFRVTRDIVDASNPAIDSIALSIMRESYARQTEARIFTELNFVQSGTITSGLVPSGAMARTSAGASLPSDLRKTILAFVNTRGLRPRTVVASSRTTVSDALETLDGSTVPEGSDAFAVTNGCGVYLSPQISGVAAGDGDVFVLASGDLWAWSSPLLEFQYYERQGPAMIDLAVFGYFGARLINPRGLASIRHT
jgi:hypothetical protein